MAELADPLAAVAAASELSAAGEWGAAASAWRAVVDDNPEHGTHWCRLALAYAEDGRPAEALPCFRQALRLGVLGYPPIPTDAGELHYRIACCHAALDQPDEALEALRGALAAGLRSPARLAADPAFAALAGDPRFTALTRQWQPGELERDAGWRADLAVLLAEIHRRSPNAARVATELDERAAALHADIPVRSDLQVLLGFWGLLRLLDDGHARLRAERAHPDWHASLPLWFHQFPEGVFVTEAEPGHERLLGAQLLALDGRPTADVLAALDPVLTRDNAYWTAAVGPLWLRRTRFLHALGVLDAAGCARLRVRTLDGAELEVDVAARPEPVDALPHTPPPPEALRLPAAASAEHLRQRARPYWFAERPLDGLLHFQFNSILDDPDEPWEPFLERLAQRLDQPEIERLVVDLRHNGGGNTFLTTALLRLIIGRPRINRPGGLFVIVGRGTFSAAQNLATLLDRYTDAVFVGEPTGSRPNFVGETVPFPLPYSRIEANISDLVWQTSWPMDRRVAIVPALSASPTFADHVAGRDAALARILAQPRPATIDQGEELGRATRGAGGGCRTASRA